MLGIPGTPPDLRAVPPGCAFHPRCSFAFGVCQTAVPALLTPSSEAPEQRVACHLYDASENPDGIPSQLREAPKVRADESPLALRQGEEA
jgi:peptide/nickel transport system ATP-binding protein